MDAEQVTVASSILIDTASDSDARSLLHIYTEVLREGRWFITSIDEYKGTEESHAKAIRDRNTETNSRLLVARMENQVVGALSITGGALERTRHVGMIELYVAQEARGKGVGKSLMEDSLIKHNSCVFRGGENAMQVLPKLIDLIPEARLNLVVYHLRSGDVNDAHKLVSSIEPSNPQVSPHPPHGHSSPFFRH